MLSGPPTPFSTQHRFWPSRGPKTSPAVATYRAARVAGKWSPHRVTRPHDDIAASSPTFVALADDQSQRRARRPRASPSRRAPHLPAHSSRPRVPQLVPLFKPPPSLGGDPNPSRLGELLPCPPVDPPEEKGVKGGEGGVELPMEGAVRREDRSRPWEEPDPPSPRTPTSPASSTSPMSHRRLPLLPPRGRAAPPHYTDTCTSARGHQGENNRFPTHVDAPAFETRWNAQSHRAAASLLVMPAFVPGWDNSFVGVAAFVDARSLSWPTLSLSLLIAVPCRSHSRRRAEPFAPELAFAFAHVATRTRRPHAIVHPSTRACRSQGQDWILVPPYLSRRTHCRV
jgi:hypothetical protein